MSILRQNVLSVVRVLSAFLILPVVSLLPAQGVQHLPLFQWSGRVDHELQIAMRGRDAWIHFRSPTEDVRTRPIVASALPRAEGVVGVRLEQGRGDVHVIEQPSAQNNFTTVVRIRDFRSGSDAYRLSVHWVGENCGRDRGWGYDDPCDIRDDDPGRETDGRGRGNRGGRGNEGRGRGNDSYGRGDDGWGRGNGRYDRELASWRGLVDDALEIRIQGNRISYRTLNGREPRGIRVDLPRQGIPRDDVDLRLREREGRGRVMLVQEPTRRNGFTTVIRIVDPRPGYGLYAFDLSWRRSSYVYAR